MCMYVCMFILSQQCCSFLTRDMIQQNIRGGRGAILTTHSMEEAEVVSSRVGIMVKGEMK